ncbi:ABC 3 transport family protein [Streptomyces cyanogenus]|uniref:ABC 3 transport family protein n=1 Tax=Streptomyces cyanogenus TaxID=80860 RepID=A0ABX7U2Q6_STRCY|nr:ABC 3 transport family protein [Streptomyces cyanogenus]
MDSGDTGPAGRHSRRTNHSRQSTYGLLAGQIVAVDTPQTTWLLGTSAVVLLALAVMWRPLTFASADPDVAEDRGVPVRRLSLAFMICSASRSPSRCRSSAHSWS